MARNDLLRHFYGGFIRLHALYHAQQGSVSGVEVMDGLERHGYKIGSGTLYPILHQMEQQGYLSSKHEVVEGRRRKNYRITSKGSQLLEDAKGRLRELTSEILAKEAPAASKGSSEDPCSSDSGSQSGRKVVRRTAKSKAASSRVVKRRPAKVRKKVR